MSKKITMTARPRAVSSSQADNWVKGPSHETPLPKEAPAGATKRLTIDLPEDTHTRFKTACARHRTKMVEEITAFIERRTAELEGQGSGA